MSIACLECQSHKSNDLDRGSIKEEQLFTVAVDQCKFMQVVKLLNLADTVEEVERQKRIISKEYDKAVQRVIVNSAKSKTGYRIQGILLGFGIGALAALFSCGTLRVDNATFIPVLASVSLLFYCFCTTKGFAKVEKIKAFDLANCPWDAVKQLIKTIADERDYSQSYMPLLFETGGKVWNTYRTICDKLNKKRERDRWESILKLYPPLNPPSVPRFVDAVILVGDRRYAEWLLAFERWLYRVTHTSKQGKFWAFQDRLWHHRFIEWTQGELKSRRKQLHLQFKSECTTWRNQIRAAYLQQFKRSPSESETPDCFSEVPEAQNIPYCYGHGHRVISHRLLKSYIKSAIPGMPPLSAKDAETTNCLSAFIRGLHGLGSLDRLIYFISMLQWHCTGQRIPDYKWISRAESGLREIFTAGEIFSCHQQGLLNTTIAKVSKYKAIIAHSTLERDIWRYVEVLCSQAPVLLVAIHKPTQEFSLSYDPFPSPSVPPS